MSTLQSMLLICAWVQSRPVSMRTAVAVRGGLAGSLVPGCSSRGRHGCANLLAVVRVVPAAEQAALARQRRPFPHLRMLNNI